MKGILSCVDTEERVIVNEKYSEQTIVIRKQLPTNFKKRLWDLLKANANVFVWIYADMTGIPRTIMVGGKPFNTKHKLNEFKHIEPSAKKKFKHPEQNEENKKKVEELMEIQLFKREYKTIHAYQTLSM
ncbi:hypothetical protein Tco_1094434 [Tanacetum coccineum]|uniref:Uncharacterized protein n=1 Tax=Tanacetum coccineum TaxID=301880 RepID=A0ABQ5IFH3_9ASTR